MTLEHWAWISGKNVEEYPGGGKRVKSSLSKDIYYKILWHLEDYVVSSVTSGGEVNLVPSRRSKDGEE